MTMHALTCDFLLVLSPSQIVCSYVAYLKRLLANGIGAFASEHSKAHITLTRYKNQHNDHPLYSWNQYIAPLRPVEITVKDFAVFSHGDNRTIYLHIPYRWAICDITYPLLGKHITPHITIARNLTPGQFDKAWKMLKSQTFSSRFSCHYITVLKRTNNNPWSNYLLMWFKPGTTH